MGEDDRSGKDWKTREGGGGREVEGQGVGCGGVGGGDDRIITTLIGA